jgi:hypothetical protein
VKVSPKQADAMQLGALAIALRSKGDIPPKMRGVYADALDRYLADGYPARAKSRPRKDQRNQWLAVDYLIRRSKMHAKRAAGELSDECATHGITIDGTAIAKLPAAHPAARALATDLLERAVIFRDPYAAALREACGHWLRAEALAAE